MPQIGVINESTAISDAEVQKMIPRLRAAMEQGFTTGLGCRRRRLQLYSKRTDATGRQLVVRILG
jgi:hypothetical protein